MKQDLQWLTVCGQNNELRLSTVEGLGGLIGALAQLLVVARLLNQVKDLRSEGLK